MPCTSMFTSTRPWFYERKGDRADYPERAVRCYRIALLVLDRRGEAYSLTFDDRCSQRRLQEKVEEMLMLSDIFAGLSSLLEVSDAKR